MVRNAKVLDAIDPEIAINHGHGVSAHLGSTGLQVWLTLLVG
jgi:hypothetical protein